MELRAHPGAVMYRYIALSHAHFASNETRKQQAKRLSALGLTTSKRAAGFTVFADSNVDVRELPQGMLLLGEIYHRDGRRLDHDPQLARLSGPEALHGHLLAHYWGSYVLLQPRLEHERQSINVLREPSGGLGCAYSLAHGFITSDVSLASQLGVYQPSVDWEFMAHCLAYPAGKISRTALAGVHELLPGCCLEWDSSSGRTATAWSPGQFSRGAAPLTDPTSAAQAVRLAVTTVVQTMAQSDVSLLLQLSGGLDSSIVGVSLKGVRARVSACTVLSPLPGADERPYALQIASQLGVDLQEAHLSLAEAGVEVRLPGQALRPAVSPLAHAAARAMDVQAERAQVNAIYSGGGGDTVFGYLKTAAPAADAFRAAGTAAGWLSVLDLTRLHGCTVTKAVWLTAKKLVTAPAAPYKQDNRFLFPPVAEPLELHPWLDLPSDLLPGMRERILDLAGNQMFEEVMLRSDGRRIRMPLLSQPVMEACLRVPSWFWIAGGRNRAVARDAFADRLPADILHRRSKGSFMNYNAALYRRHKDRLRRFLLDGALHAHGLLDGDQLDAYFKRPLGSRDQSFLRIFELCTAENFVRQRG
ncbi:MULTISPECIES: asparagine synthase C-terminal domain-containing protein [Pseudoxanthomonas]|uniref:asparagine synthase (glutamine-hydrolyzing) n=1 Tax=Pseudoxanthomonas winnipegensis TaxID=2480810 RepID=A0AAW8GFG3_9GAMM|nr:MULTISPECIES: asparagine synthase C-terminal domain-containing protein [Pseudoxanthomonas]MDQ1121240.1 asparagine synthase (glutamine-hydrolyzing) [Pseudoxanthomonas winnipegensis]MDR6139297.1 asparagine synthase (glutamine-hydrolyzing) [Pseudoxanthomonas sp. SORGH_AS_0997]